MKIGILTFHCVQNYGAVLQAFALQEFLKARKHLVCIIDYRPEYLADTTRLAPKSLRSRPVRLAKHMVKSVADFGGRLKFRAFVRSRLSLCPFSPESLGGFDAILFGSDQIWNTDLTKGVDKVFWGLFPVRPGVKRIAYAASAGAGERKAARIPDVVSALQRFDAVSVRELSLKQVIQPLTHKPVAFVLDPTLLVPGRVLMRLTDAHSPCAVPYVLVYEVCPLPETLVLAKHLARQIGEEAVVVKPGATSGRRGGVLYVNGIGPEDLLTYIRFARCVVTTSYHGTALSISFSKDFYTVRVNEGIDSRASSLLDSLGLQGRLIGKTDAPELTAVDYERAGALLAERRTQSENFLAALLG